MWRQEISDGVLTGVRANGVLESSYFKTGTSLCSILSVLCDDTYIHVHGPAEELDLIFLYADGCEFSELEAPRGVSSRLFAFGPGPNHLLHTVQG